MQTTRRSGPPNGRSTNAWRRFVDSATNRRDTAPLAVARPLGHVRPAPGPACSRIGASTPSGDREDHDPDESLAFAALELERRFGRLTKAPVPADGAW